jgi:acetolactate synthase-1/2/3 large subunit
MHGGDLVVQVIKDQGVKFVFTLCGGHISPILTGATAAGLRVVDTRHEATAVFAADAVARISGIPGVVAVTAGPGLTNAVTAVKNAQLAQSPLIIIGGATATVLRGKGALQDIDQMALMKPHVKLAIVVNNVRDIVPSMEKAFAVARAGVPGPVFVELPVDVLYPESVVREWYGLGDTGGGLAGWAQRKYLEWHLNRMFAGTGTTRSGAPPVEPLPSVPSNTLLQVARKLESAKHPVLIVGSQAVCEADKVSDLANAIGRLGIPVYLSGMARGLLGENHPLHFRHRRRDALKEADLVILAGVPCDFRLNYGRAIRRSTTLISANRSRHDLKLNRKPDIGIVADAGGFLTNLSRVASAAGGEWADWRAEMESRDRQRELQIDEQALASGERVNPIALCRAVNKTMAEDSVVIADGGDFVGTASYIVRPRAPLSWLDPGAFGTLGVGAGFALGASLCRPESQIWIVFGDGSVGYSLAEFDTFVRHKIPVIAVVGNDACWSQIAREQVKLLEDDTAVMLDRTEYQRVVAGFGAVGLVIHKDDESDEVLRQAVDVAAGGHPVLVNALLDQSDFREGSLSI